MDGSRASVSTFTTTYAWSAALVVLAAYALWLVGWYWDTAASMVATWYRSETFAHGFLVAPISAWLVWRRRKLLVPIRPQPGTSLLPMALLLASVAIWLAGELTDVIAVRQFAFVSLLVGGIWLVVGNTVARSIAFPLAFLYFAVPVGEILLPTLVEWTASVTVAALRASGVPVWREGMTFQIPTGSWSIVEACSGLRYLIASATVGTLYAYLAYRSLKRRLMFIGVALVVPVVANWMRAYMIVMLGHLSGNTIAVGVDHLIYGWIFFGLVMLLLFMIGGIWREDEGEIVHVGGARREQPSEVAIDGRKWQLIVGAAFVVLAIAPWAVRQLGRLNLPSDAVVNASAPVLGSWNPEANALVSWTPQFLPARKVIAATYARADERVGLYVALYFDQDAASKLVSTENQLLHTTDDSGHVVSDKRGSLGVGAGKLEFDETLLRRRDARILARTWFWIDGEFVASPLRAKLAQAMSVLRGHGDAGAIIVTYVLLPPDGAPVSPSLDDFTREIASSLGPMLAERFQKARQLH